MIPHCVTRHEEICPELRLRILLALLHWAGSTFNQSQMQNLRDMLKVVAWIPIADRCLGDIISFSHFQFSGYMHWPFHAISIFPYRPPPKRVCVTAVWVQLFKCEFSCVQTNPAQVCHAWSCLRSTRESATTSCGSGLPDRHSGEVHSTYWRESLV